MPNTNRPCGFQPYGSIRRVGKYVAGAEIFPGDMLIGPASDGQVDPSAGGAAELLLGVALNYASAAGQEVLVADDPDQLYSVQMNSGETEATTQVGDYCEVRATAGNATYRQSRQEVDTVAETATKPLRIVRLDTPIGAEVNANMKVVVSINTAALQS
jgi:hypothetical protein